MLDDEETFHATREGFAHLSDSEWNAVKRLSSSLGDTVANFILETLNRDQQHATISKFIEGELVAER